ncbi:MAG: TolC family protein [Bacteroidetes bacterium]|nr:TolC family protein [Bacteroidota bacterium]
MKSFWILLLSIVFGFAQAQELLSEENYIKLVLQNHPLAKQADWMESQGFAKLLKAKGWFDPKVDLAYDQKNFDDKNYFQTLASQVKIPTWIGADVKFAYNWNAGLYINPENNIPSNGLISAGIELPILQGLIFDKRRADLQQGKNYAQMGSLERAQALNELVYEASKAYWMWYEAYQIRQIAEEGLKLAENTFQLVKSSYALGDKAAIDTLEALIQLQNRKIDLSSAEMAYFNNKLWASSFLWLESGEAAELQAATIPELFILDALDLNSYIQTLEGKEDSLLASNPKLQWYAFKIKNFEIEKRLKKEMLKPQLSLGYNFLNQPLEKTPFDQFNIANYKWNLKFSMPIFLRKERADLKITSADLAASELEFKNLQLQQRNKLLSVQNKILVYQDQITLNSKNLEDNKNLVLAEKKKFSIGESSLFLVNYREINLLKVMQKQAEIEAKLKTTLAELEYTIGW